MEYRRARVMGKSGMEGSGVCGFGAADAGGAAEEVAGGGDGEAGILEAFLEMAAVGEGGGVESEHAVVGGVAE